jgi:phage N-6-adenine-methyltransferase
MEAALAPLGEAKRVVALARETGDAAALAKLAALGDAVQKLALAKGAREDALDAGEVYVRAMVALAEMDIEAAPHAPGSSAPTELQPLGGMEKNARAEWRKLAAGSDIADLDDLVSYFREDEGNAGFSRAALVRAWKGFTGDGPHVTRNTGEVEWYTPAEYIASTVAVMGGIDLDPASNAEANKVVGAKEFYTAEDDGLTKPWAGRVWMNPPYARPLVDRFCEKLAESYAEGSVTAAVVLVNNGTDSAWWQAMARAASAICLLNRRVRFWRPSGLASSPLQGQALVYFGVDVDRFADVFDERGIVLVHHNLEGGRSDY